MNERRRAQIVDRSLRIRTRVFLAIFTVSLVIAVVDVVRIGASAILPVVAAFVLAVAVGIPVSRMFRLSWNEVDGKVIGRIDAVGVVILVIYALISIFRTSLADLWFDGALAAAVAVAILAGLMLGQVVGTQRGVHRVLALATRGTEPDSPADETETAYLSRDGENARRLRESVDRLERGEVTPRERVDPEAG